MKKPWLFLLLMLWACSPDKGTQDIQLGLTGSGALKLTGLDIAIMHDIDRDTARDKWQNLFPVYRMPAPDDSNNYALPQPGAYTIAGNHVQFTPDTPFVKGTTYYVRFYLYNQGVSMWDVLTKKTRPGQYSYRDILFDPQYLKNK